MVERNKSKLPKAAIGAARAGKPADATLLTAYADYIRTECHLSQNTVSAYRRDLRRFYEWLAGRQPGRLTRRRSRDPSR